MNFRDMTPEEKAYYEKIKQREDTIDYLLRVLTVVATATLIATIIMLFA